MLIAHHVCRSVSYLHLISYNYVRLNMLVDIFGMDKCCLRGIFFSFSESATGSGDAMIYKPGIIREHRSGDKSMINFSN